MAPNEGIGRRMGELLLAVGVGAVDITPPVGLKVCGLHARVVGLSRGSMPVHAAAMRGDVWLEVPEFQ